MDNDIYGIHEFGMKDHHVPDGYLAIGRNELSGRRIAVSKEDGLVYLLWDLGETPWDFKEEIMNLLDECEELIDEHDREVETKHAHGTQNLDRHTSSTKKIVDATMELFERIMDKSLLSRRITLAACNVIREDEVPESEDYVQLEFFSTPNEEQQEQEDKALEKERALQEAMLKIKHKYGKNAVLKGTNYTEGATAKDRNRQIGGHKA